MMEVIILSAVSEAASKGWWTYANQILLILLFSGTVIEIVPIKINPITSIINFLMRTVKEDVNKQIDIMKTDVDENIKSLKEQDAKLEELLQEIKEDGDKRDFAHCRWEILTFANSLYNGSLYTTQEYLHIKDSINRYNELHEKYKFENGYTDDAIDQITKHYKECKDSGAKYF